ncbi:MULTISPECIES: TolC family protein [unclassified Halanaerobium]|uniref:TolC family protein n=1 Tax=unclassified Halanaerobium TaxID=2641197 RepID=UPI000E126974|nr:MULTISPECIES: TolC family protein [unclassified Halanaerobium]RCW49929.1 outer membrane protein TolC [Halanaerobium sp. MA284_MarDTE_T2]RCW79022.1 outer membrane protein TolC [Halanaerobium sp. DL-01]
MHKKIQNKTAIIFALILIILSVSTAVQAAEELELKKAVKILFEQNRTLKNARKDIENAEKDIQLTVRSYFPTLNLQSSYTKMDEGQPQISSFGPVEGPDENYSTSVNLTQPLWLGGKIGIQKEIAGYNLEIARSNYEKVLEEQLFNLIQSYYGVLQAEGMVEIRKEALNIVNEHLRVVKNRIEAGTAIRQDLLRSQIEQRSAKEELSSARNDLKIARRRLSQLLASEAEYNTVRPEIDFDINLNQNELFKTAVENNPDLMVLELNRQIVKLTKKLDSQYYRPDIALNGSYDWSGDEFMSEEGENWSLTVGVSVPLYDGGKGNINAKKRANQMEKINNNQQDLLENLQIEIKDVVLNVEENKQSIELEKLSLENAKENLAIANVSYRAGVASNTDVIDAQSTYNQAKVSLLQAEYSYEIEQFRTLYKSGRIKEYFKDVINNEK